MVNKRAKLNKTCLSEADLLAESTESGAIVGSNDDLLTEILRRLPITSILRFKSVSKHWHSLLSHRRFTLLHNLPVSPGLFLHDLYITFDVKNSAPPPFRRLNIYPNRSRIKIVQSCNGLLLCRSNRGQEYTRKYYVFNPTTKQFAVIPSLIGGSGATRTIRFMGLAFHTENCVHYKLVCFCNVNRYRELLQIQIYSSETGKWKILQESISASDFTSFDYEVNYGVYLNGAVHWIPHGFNMVYFKLDIERLHTMLLQTRPSWSRVHYFGESGGHLHLVKDVLNENPLHLHVFEMLSDYSGWFVKYRVELDELPAAYPYTAYNTHGPSKYFFKVVDVVRCEKEEEEEAANTFVVVRTHDKIIRYNVYNKSFKQLSDLPSIYQRYHCGDYHRYTRNLSSF